MKYENKSFSVGSTTALRENWDRVFGPQDRRANIITQTHTWVENGVEWCALAGWKCLHCGKLWQEGRPGRKSASS